MAEPDSSMRVPKGILKNKYGGGSSGGREGGRGDYAAPLHYGHGGGGVGTIPGGWDPQLGMHVAPVPAPQHGMNMPNPVLDLVMRGIKLTSVGCAVIQR